MVQIPYIKIPSVRVGSIDPTTDIGTGGATPAPPAPVTYLTQWKIVGNSEVHGQEIWSCGEYSATDGKWHILVQPLGGSIVDIALTEPFRKVNDVADTIEFSSGTEGKALVTRTYTQAKVRDLEFIRIGQLSNCIRFKSKILETKYYSNTACNILFDQYICMSIQNANTANQPYVIASYIEQLYLYCPLDITTNDEFNERYGDYDIVYELATPTTELVDAPQIAEAESYSMVISQGAKAVSWSEFLYTLNYLLTDSENNLLVDNENYKLTVQS